MSNIQDRTEVYSTVNFKILVTMALYVLGGYHLLESPIYSIYQLYYKLAVRQVPHLHF